MPTGTTTPNSLVPPTQQSPGSVRVIASNLRSNAAQSQDTSLWSSAGDALGSIQGQLDHIWAALQSNLPIPNPFQIFDPSGNLIAEIGDFVDQSNNTAYSGIWANNLYVGGSGPATAFLVASESNGQVFVLDPYGNIGAWLGAQSEGTLSVTGAVSAAGLIKLTVTAHGYTTGDQVNVEAVGGVPAADGQWLITVVDANHFTLDGSTFAGGYTSGGTVNRYFAGGLFSTIAVGGAQRISNVADNGSGLVRVTVTAHGYATGYAVILTGVEGVPNVNDLSWQITVIDANNFDLIGSTFAGTYTGGGLSLNWPTAKLIARADGSLAINNATITLSNNGVPFFIASSSNIWATDIYIGGTGVSTAPFFSNGSIVAIGQNGQVFVLDPYGNIGAWLGTQSEANQNVSGAVSAGGLIELTVAAHGYVTGDEVNVAAVGGVTAATGQWLITVVDANHFTLDGSTFSGTYTSGGTVNRFFAGGLFSTIAVGGAMQVSGVANNGSGLARVTVTAHGYATGYAVVLTGVTGVPGINDVSWQITVIDANNFDLVGSTFSGSYTGGGLALNWPTAKLIARDDGSLDITNALITLVGTNGSIVLNPNTPSFVLTNGTVTVTIDGTNFVKVNDSSAGYTQQTASSFVAHVLGTTATLISTSLTVASVAHTAVYGNAGITIDSNVGFTGTLAAAIAGSKNVIGGIIY